MATQLCSSRITFWSSFIICCWTSISFSVRLAFTPFCIVNQRSVVFWSLNKRKGSKFKTWATQYITCVMLSNILFPCRNYDCLCLHFSSTSVKSFCDQTRSSILFQLITFTDRGFFNCNSSCHHRDKKKVPVGKKVYSGAAAANVLM